MITHDNFVVTVLSSYMREQITVSFAGFLFDNSLAIVATTVTTICSGHEGESCDGFVSKSHDRSVDYVNDLINGYHYGHHYPLMAINGDNCH